MQRIICFTGSGPGAGTTTLALNLAVAWAGLQARGVVVVQVDPLCGDELAATLGVAGPTLAALIRHENAVFLGHTPLVVPLSKWAVGSLPLARDMTEGFRVDSAAARRALTRLNGRYDLFIDAPLASPLRAMAMRMADLTFAVEAPARHRRVKVFADAKERTVFHLPHEPEMGRHRILAVENVVSEWVKALRVPLAMVRDAGAAATAS